MARSHVPQTMLADRLRAVSPGVGTSIVPGQRGAGTIVPATEYSTWSASSTSELIAVTPSGTDSAAPARLSQTACRPALRAPTASVRSTSSNRRKDRKSTRLNSSHVKISYAVFCLKKKKKRQEHNRAKLRE